MPILKDANEVLINFDGELAYLQDTMLWIRDDSDIELIGATVEFNNSDLGVPDIDKLINYADVDYEGAFTLTFKLDGVAIHTMDFIEKATRSSIWQDFPLVKRKAFRKLQMTIAASAKDTKIYGIEIDFDVLRRRRYN